MQATLTDGTQVEFGGVLRMKEFRALTHFEAAGDLEKTYPILARLVKKWSLEYDPAKPESYDELTLPQFRDIMSHLAEYLQASVEAKN